jgi:hypothetical protein
MDTINPINPIESPCQCSGQKALQIILAIRDICNEHDITIFFDKDIGSNTLSVHFDDHEVKVGTLCGSESDLIDSLYDLFVTNSGLSAK